MMLFCNSTNCLLMAKLDIERRRFSRLYSKIPELVSKLWPAYDTGDVLLIDRGVKLFLVSTDGSCGLDFKARV